jgi:nucleotide-binding universal stress UspA family protein
MSWHSHVIVGYDGSRRGERVIRWAVTEAKLRRIALTICHAWHFDYPISQMDPEWLGIVKRMAEHVLDHGVFHARAAAPTLKINKSLLPAPAAPALLHEADDAELIVLGSRGNGEPAGSTAVQVAAMADCPVVVLRDVEPADGRIIVGVDGSPGSDAALAFAFEEAALRDWRVHAVHGCREREIGPDTDVEDLKRAAGVMLERSVAPWREKYPHVAAWTHLVLEPPREALIEASAGAEMLVVGNRGLGGFEPLMLGAVSQAMLHHAPCTVAVAHPWRPPDERSRREREERRARRTAGGSVSQAARQVT